MVRQLNIRNDEAFETARRLAEQLGRSQTDVVLEALRRYSDQILAPSRRVTPEQIAADREMLDRLIADANRDRPADMTSDHSFLYDEYGLPK